MGMRVLFLQSVHQTHDERVWYHQRASLIEHGAEVEVIGALVFPMWKNQQKRSYDVIITDTPKAVLKAHLYSFNKSTKIVYDITEWYPSKKNLKIFFLFKPIKALVLLLFNLWAGCMADAFIFGEKDKMFPFSQLFPNKKYILLPYYPDLTYLSPSEPRDISKCCSVLYAGPLTAEKGWDNVQETLAMAAKILPEIRWKLIVISNNDLHFSISMPSAIAIEYHPYMPFMEFCHIIQEADVMLDLRKIDRENTRCLPIKLFYYMACGKPSIYSNLQAITKAIPDISKAVFLVSDAKSAATILCRLVREPLSYVNMCNSALSMAHNNYNWSVIIQTFIQFIYAV